MAKQQGRLTIEKLEGVFKDLSSRKFTGTISVWDERAWKEFYFAGSGVRVTSVGDRKTLPLGEFLTRRGFVEQEAVDKALEKQQTNFNMLGEILVESEELEPERRDKALLWQVEEELSDLYFWHGPRYEYEPGPQTGQYSEVERKRAETNTKSLSVNAEVSGIIRGAREAYKEMMEVRNALRMGGVYRLTELGRQKLFVKGGFKALSDPEQRIVVLLDGKRTLEEIQKRAHVLPRDTLRIMHKLENYGAVKLAD